MASGSRSNKRNIKGTFGEQLNIFSKLTISNTLTLNALCHEYRLLTDVRIPSRTHDNLVDLGQGFFDILKNETIYGWTRNQDDLKAAIQSIKDTTGLNGKV